LKIPNFEVIRNRKLKRDREYNDQKKNDNNNNKKNPKTHKLQNITQKAKDRTTRSQYKSERNSGAPEGSVVPALHETPVVLLLNDMNII